MRMETFFNPGRDAPLSANLRYYFGCNSRSMNGVAPDGSPVEIYAALPAEPELSRVRSLLAPGARILDLGCGTGRIANPLAADGHAVVASTIQKRCWPGSSGQRP